MEKFKESNKNVATTEHHPIMQLTKPLGTHIMHAVN